MAQYSPELTEQTISIFKSRTCREISGEDARQAVENISGFFRILQEWAEAEQKESCGCSADDSAKAERVAP